MPDAQYGIEVHAQRGSHPLRWVPLGTNGHQTVLDGAIDLNYLDKGQLLPISFTGTFEMGGTGLEPVTSCL